MWPCVHLLAVLLNAWTIFEVAYGSHMFAKKLGLPGYSGVDIALITYLVFVLQASRLGLFYGVER